MSSSKFLIHGDLEDRVENIEEWIENHEDNGGGETPDLDG